MKKRSSLCSATVQLCHWAYPMSYFAYNDCCQQVCRCPHKRLQSHLQHTCANDYSNSSARLDIAAAQMQRMLSCLHLLSSSCLL